MKRISRKHLFFVTSLLLGSLLLSLQTAASSTLQMAAFNTHVFGKTKAGNTKILHKFAKIVSRYDLILLQEIRNSDESAVYKLLSEVNKISNKKYQLIISPPLGRSSFKEQYAYFYRPQKLKLLESFVYDDGPEPYLDSFSREPFIARFKNQETQQVFNTIGVHVSPQYAIDEIRVLKEVFDQIDWLWPDNASIIFGDLNAACNFAPAEQLEELSIKNSPQFSWQITDNIDTTTRTISHCAYDRIITTGKITSSVVEGSAKPFNFKTEWNLSQQEAEDISDHWPVEIKINY